MYIGANDGVVGGYTKEREMSMYTRSKYKKTDFNFDVHLLVVSMMRGFGGGGGCWGVCCCTGGRGGSLAIVFTGHHLHWPLSSLAIIFTGHVLA